MRETLFSISFCDGEDRWFLRIKRSLESGLIFLIAENNKGRVVSSETGGINIREEYIKDDFIGLAKKLNLTLPEEVIAYQIARDL